MRYLCLIKCSIAEHWHCKIHPKPESTVQMVLNNQCPIQWTPTQYCNLFRNTYLEILQNIYTISRIQVAMCIKQHGTYVLTSQFQIIYTVQDYAVGFGFFLCNLNSRVPFNKSVIRLTDIHCYGLHNSSMFCCSFLILLQNILSGIIVW